MKAKGLTVIILSAFILTGCIYVNETDEDRRDNRNQRNAELLSGRSCWIWTGRGHPVSSLILNMTGLKTQFWMTF